MCSMKNRGFPHVVSCDEIALGGNPELKRTWLSAIFKQFSVKTSFKLKINIIQNNLTSVLLNQTFNRPPQTPKTVPLSVAGKILITAKEESFLI
jgi:hypothetical protein